MRDQLNIYQQREKLNIPCISCSNLRHQLPKCPIINYIPNREAVINTYLKESFQNRKFLPRRPQKVSNAFIMQPKLIEYSKVVPLKYPEFVGGLFPEEEDEEYSSCSSSQRNVKSRSALTLDNLDNSPLEKNEKDEKKDIKLSNEQIKQSVDQIDNTEFKRKVTKRKTYTRQTTAKNHTLVSEGGKSPGKDPLVNFEVGRNYKSYFPNNNLSEIIRLDSLRRQSLSSPKNSKNRLSKARERMRSKGNLTKGALDSNDSVNQLICSKTGMDSHTTFKNLAGKDFTIAVEQIKEEMENH